MPRFPHLLVFAPTLALAASPMSRLQGVSEHARAQATSGPDHLWVGLAIGLAVAAAVGLAALWALRGRKGAS